LQEKEDFNNQVLSDNLVIDMFLSTSSTESPANSLTNVKFNITNRTSAFFIFNCSLNNTIFLT
jgi:hypothetical protein